MFGYILPDKGELKVKEYEVYGAYYCGICKSLGRRLGQLPRMVLNYDFVFLGVLLSALEEGREELEAEHCVLHHIKKKAIAYGQWAVDYAGDVTLMMAYYKLLDDVKDDGSTKAKMLATTLKSAMTKVESQIKDLCRLTGAKLDELSVLEDSKSGELDRVMEPFAEVMRQVFAEALDKKESYDKDVLHIGEVHRSDDKANQNCDTKSDDMTCDEHKRDMHKKLLGHIGYHLGKWVYLMDAFEDIEENLEKGTYNPLIYRFEYDKDKESVSQFRERIKETVSFNLMHYLAEISNAVDLLDIKKNKGIVENIVYFGLRKRTEQVLNNEKKKEEKLHE